MNTLRGGEFLNKINRKLLMCLLLTVVFVSGDCVVGQAADIEEGRKLYDKYCSTCHGEKGVGQDPERRAGGFDSNRVPIAPALNGTSHTWHHSPSYLFKYIKQGSIVGNSPMPSFGGELNKHQVLSIISYFQSLWPDKRREYYFKKYK